MTCDPIKPTQVYGLCSSESPGSIRYVGQTTKPLHVRLKEHRAHAKRYAHRHLSNWIRSVFSRGHTVQIVLLRANAIWNATEKEVISQQRERGADLVNATDGGEGRQSVNWTDEMRAKLSEKMRGRKKSENHKKALSDALVGRVLSEEHRKKVSDGLRGRAPKNLAGLHDARRGRPVSAEQREKISSTLKGRQVTPTDVLMRNLGRAA